MSPRWAGHWSCDVSRSTWWKAAQKPAAGPAEAVAEQLAEGLARGGGPARRRAARGLRELGAMDRAVYAAVRGTVAIGVTRRIARSGQAPGDGGLAWHTLSPARILREEG